LPATFVAQVLGEFISSCRLGRLTRARPPDCPRTMRADPGDRVGREGGWYPGETEGEEVRVRKVGARSRRSTAASRIPFWISRNQVLQRCSSLTPQKSRPERAISGGNSCLFTSFVHICHIIGTIFSWSHFAIPLTSSSTPSSSFEMSCTTVIPSVSSIAFRNSATVFWKEVVARISQLVVWAVVESLLHERARARSLFSVALFVVSQLSLPSCSISFRESLGLF